jgi:mannonate dehydratase
MYSMKQTMSWFGPGDPVSLSDIRQAGCSGVVTTLHHIPPGEVWPRSEILKRKKQIEESGLDWDVVENLPVHENIKTQSANFERYIENYQKSIRNVAACGIHNIVYNFSPLLDRVRTDLNYTLDDGSKAMRFERAAMMAFDVFILKHSNAEKHYSKEDLKKAEHRFSQMSNEEKGQLQKNILAGLSNGSENFNIGEFRGAVDRYKKMNAHKYRQYLFYFLHEILPVADEWNIKLAIHPDDPPYPILGLPRIASTAADLNLIFEAAPSLNNGLCFCSGSLGARKNNDLPSMVGEFYDRIHFLHFSNVQRNNRDFWETNHLQGSIDMYAVLRQIILIMQKRGVSIPVCAGRSLLGELRGLEMGIQRMLMD